MLYSLCQAFVSPGQAKVQGEWFDLITLLLLVVITDGEGFHHRAVQPETQNKGAAQPPGGHFW